MSTTETPAARRRNGGETRRLVQQVALRLFTQQGYDATSLRQIADELGINKASLYYHFSSKESILRSLFEQRGSEAHQLLEWLDRQPASPDLLEKTVLRWVDSFSIDKLRGIRFIRANPHIARVLGDEGERIGDALTTLAARLVALTPDPSPERALLTRMAILSINAAVEAAVDSGVTDEAVVAAARTAARALIRAPAA